MRNEWIASVGLVAVVPASPALPASPASALPAATGREPSLRPAAAHHHHARLHHVPNLHEWRGRMVRRNGFVRPTQTTQH